LHAFAVGLLVLAVSSLTHANEFLAAFAAGVTMATIGSHIQEDFQEFGELVVELLKLAALLVFGALISLEFLWGELHPRNYLFVLLVLVLARPVAFGLALLGSSLNWRERVAAAWFGPKGFASVVFGLMLWRSEAARAEQIFHLAALVITVSIIAHSSTDILVARWFRKTEAASSNP
jgi:NhaP-type Na+/H+ or K+/H+ antiporter